MKLPEIARSAKSAIVLLLIILVIIHSVFLRIYQLTFSTEPFWGQIWGYIASDTFKLVTISLILPILMFLLDAIFKIRSAVEERLREARESKREQRWQCLEATADAWNLLYNLSGKLLHFKIDDQKEDTIRQIILDLHCYTNSTEDTVNMWAYRFDNLEAKDTNLFLYIVNSLLISSFAVAYSIKLNDDTNEIKELQDCLRIIMNGLKTIAHHPLLSVLKLSIQYLDTDDKSERTEYEEEIQKELKILKGWVIELMKLELEHIEQFTAAKGENRKAIRASAKKLEEWKQVNQKKPFNEAPEFKEFKAQFYKLSLDEYEFDSNNESNKKYVRHLCQYLAYEDAFQTITSRADMNNQIQDYIRQLIPPE